MTARSSPPQQTLSWLAGWAGQVDREGDSMSDLEARALRRRTLHEALVQTHQRLEQVNTQLAELTRPRYQVGPDELEPLDRAALDRLEQLNYERDELVAALLDQERTYAAEAQQHLPPDAGEGEQR